MAKDADESSQLIEKDEEDWSRHNCCQATDKQNPYDSYIRPLIGEFLGTLMLVYLGSMSQVSGSLIIISAGYGLTLVFLVTMLGSVSGAHVNPAVTLGVALSGNISVLLTILYMLAQLAGSVTGAALLVPTLDSTTYTSINGGTPVLDANVSILRGLLMETVLTFILVLVVLLSAVDKRLMCAPLAIGSALLVDILAGGPISGAAVNPAVAFGPAVIFSTESTTQWHDHWLYWVGAVLGSVVAAISFRFILASPEKRTVCHDKDDDDK